MTETRQISWREWGLLALLMSAMMFSIIDRFALAVLLEPIKSDLELSDSQLGLLNGIAFGLFYATMGLPLGWLADRWSRKGVVVGGVAIWSAATAACGLANSYLQLLIARIMVGAGEAGLAPVSYSILHDRFPPARLGSAISLLQVGSIAGSGLAIMVVGVVYSLVVGLGADASPLPGLKPWQLTFILVALPGLFFVLAFSLMKNPPPAAKQGGTEKIGLLTALASNPVTYASLFAGMSGIVVALYALFSWIPAILVREFGWTETQVAGTYGGIVLLFSPAGALFGGWLCDRLIARGVKSAHALIAMGAACLAIPAFVVIGIATTSTVLLTGVAVAQFAITIPNGLGPALTQRLAPDSARTQVSALYVMSANLIGIGVGPVAVGFLSENAFSSVSGLKQSAASVSLVGLVIAVPLLWQLSRRLGRNKPGKRDEIEVVPASS